MSDSPILQDWLPVKPARKILLWTWPVAIGGASLVHFLRPLMPSLTEAEIVLLQSSVFLFLALLGALISLFLVVRAYHAQDVKHLTELEDERAKHKTKISLENSARFNKKIDYPKLPIV